MGSFLPFDGYLVQFSFFFGGGAIHPLLEFSFWTSLPQVSPLLCFIHDIMPKQKHQPRWHEQRNLSTPYDYSNSIKLARWASNSNYHPLLWTEHFVPSTTHILQFSSSLKQEFLMREVCSFLNIKLSWFTLIVLYLLEGMLPLCFNKALQMWPWMF